MSNSKFDDFYYWFSTNGLEQFNKFYSFYDASVVQTDDPLKLGRILVLCEAVGNKQAPEIWAYPAFMGSGANRGWFWPPEVGDRVWIAYPLGKLNSNPLYFGGWFAGGELPAELGYPAAPGTIPSRRGFVTRGGHAFVLNDEQGKEEVTLTWHQAAAPYIANESADRTAGLSASLKFTATGSIELTAANSSKIVIDAGTQNVTITDQANGNVITLDSTGIKITAPTKLTIESTAVDVNADLINLGSTPIEPAVLGLKLLTWLNSHVHPTAVGPSGPPAVPATPSLLSAVVKVK